MPPSPGRTAVKFSTASLPPSAVMRVSPLGFLQLRVVALAVSSRHKHRTTRGSPSVTFSEPSGKPDILYHAIMGQSSADDGEGRAEPHHSVSRAYIVRTHVPTKSRPTFLSLSLSLCVCVCVPSRALLTGHVGRRVGDAYAERRQQQHQQTHPARSISRSLCVILWVAVAQSLLASSPSPSEQ